MKVCEIACRSVGPSSVSFFVKKMVCYSEEESMLLRDSKYIIRRDADKFSESF